MRLAILGATSQIAKDLIVSLSQDKSKKLDLFARRPEDVNSWLTKLEVLTNCTVQNFNSFGSQEYDAVINFVGTGNPYKTAQIGASIFDITSHFDEMVLKYLELHVECRYIFLSSGAAYGVNYDNNVTVDSHAKIPINDLQPTDWYGVAKLYAECRHRSLSHLSIVDVRVFNYFSHTLDLDAKFLITDIIRSIRDEIFFSTSAENIVRDFVGPSDFYKLINSILTSPPINLAIDCYSKSPVDKFTVLEAMQENFGLKYKLTGNETGFNATGAKKNYFSTNRKASSLGYIPDFTSLQNLVDQIGLIKSVRSKAKKLN